MPQNTCPAPCRFLFDGTHRFGPEDDAFTNRHVIRDAHLSCNDRPVTNHARSGNAGLRAAITTLRPMVQLCAMCTRLSIFVPWPMRVSPSAPLSIVTLAPIQTSSSITSRPCCGKGT